MKIHKILGLKKNSIIKTEEIINQIKKKNTNYNKLPLGLQNFDRSILSGGFLPNNIYLLFGSNKTGKTQICHQLCIQNFMGFLKNHENQYVKNKILTYYLDTENTFRPERIKEIASFYNLNYSEVLSSINVSKIMSNVALYLKLKEIQDQGNLNDVTLLIIDSINNYYRAEQGNKNVSFHNLKNMFNKVLKSLNNIKKNQNLIILSTAQITSNLLENEIIKEIPVGNQFLNHYISEYFYLKIKNNQNFIHLVNSQYFSEKKLAFKITSEGIVDYKI